MLRKLNTGSKVTKPSGAHRRKILKEWDAAVGLTSLSSIVVHKNVKASENDSENDIMLISIDSDTTLNTSSSSIVDINESEGDQDIWSIQLNDADEPDKSAEADDVSNEFRYKIKEWAFEHKPTQSQLKGLLKVLRDTLNFKLPMDPRTIMKTPNTVNITSFGSNQYYWHHGLKVSLQMCFQRIQPDKRPSNIELNISLDGVKLFNSSSDEFWPILFNIDQFNEIPPKVIGIYHGKGK